MGIVIRLLRHIPAYVLLTYTDERNSKMFHGFERFVHLPVDKLACPGGSQFYGRQRDRVRQALSAAEGGAEVRDRGRQRVELVLRECESIYARSLPFAIRSLRFFAVIGGVLVSLLVLARRVLP